MIHDRKLTSHAHIARRTDRMKRMATILRKWIGEVTPGSDLDSRTRDAAHIADPDGPDGDVRRLYEAELVEVDGEFTVIGLELDPKSRRLKPVTLPVQNVA